MAKKSMVLKQQREPKFSFNIRLLFVSAINM